MIQEQYWYRWVIKISDFYNKIINFICVFLLTAQLISILVMVIGRYLFSYVPAWTEQFALFCMTWFAMFSIALATRTDSHVKMEVIDTLGSAKTLRWFKLFGNICTFVFGYVLTVYGLGLSEMTWTSMLSAFRVPVGLQYASAIAGGFFMMCNAIVYCIEMFVTFHDEHLKKEGVA